MSETAASHAAQRSSQSLAVLIGAGADPQALATYLDGLSSTARIAEVQGLARAMLQRLYARCESSPPLLLTDMVSTETPCQQEVIFAGCNNLPLFRLFEKRFAKTPGGAIVGYNHQSMRAVTGPGYFTVVPAGNELLIDYTKTPTRDEVPATWPTPQPNNRGLSHLVYKNLHDFCRRVSRDVVIGHATRLGTSLPQYFVLVRRNAD